MGVTEPQGDGGFQVCRRADGLLANISRHIHDMRNHPLRHKTGTVADHTDGFAIAGKQRVRRFTHVDSGGWVGGDNASFGCCIGDQHVDADCSAGVEAINRCKRGHVKSERRNHDQGFFGWKCAGFDDGPQVLE